MQKTRVTSAKKAVVQKPEQVIESSTIVSEKKKRGRKKTMEPLQQQHADATNHLVIAPKKKRVNKKHSETSAVEPTQELVPEPQSESSYPIQIKEPTQLVLQQEQEQEQDIGVVVVAAHKKRGRKPKGGKVIQQLVHEAVSMHDTPNIILHLKCSVSDIPDSNSGLSSDISVKPGDVVSFSALEPKGADLNDSYASSSSSSSSSSNGNFIIGSNLKPKYTPDALIATNSYNHLNDDADCDDSEDDDANASNDSNLKDIWKKLNHLKLCFHKSDVFQNIGAGTRRSCCFWDTCEFDTPPVYIPKCIAANGGYNVYGCFCSPECALAYLMNEGVDTSVKFERCQMLNSMYGKLLNYEKSIKPAPNPQYILNKFYGNLSIQEYRKLFKSEQIVYVVNKPLTHILPEMYEDNNDFLLNNKVIPNNNYKLKKKTSAFG